MNEAPNFEVGRSSVNCKIIYDASKAQNHMITTSFTKILHKKKTVTGIFMDVRVKATRNTSPEPRQLFDNEGKGVLLLLRKLNLLKLERIRFRNVRYSYCLQFKFNGQNER